MCAGAPSLRNKGGGRIDPVIVRLSCPSPTLRLRRRMGHPCAIIRTQSEPRASARAVCGTRFPPGHPTDWKVGPTCYGCQVMMPENATISPEARCLGCGYLLRGLPEPVCPECGRRFDPLDASTFDAKPRARRRRSWIKRRSVALAIAWVTFGLFPRRMLKSDMTFTCTRCGALATVKRWEPKPPRWIPVRYPGIHWTSRASPSEGTTAPGCDAHRYDVNVRFDLFIGGWCSGRGLYKRGEVVTFNDRPATLATAARVLKALTDPSNFGIAVGCGQAP